MKKIFISILIIISGYVATGQQLPQFTQYMINDYVFNPAIAGVESGYQVKSNIRNQWVGINDAPRTTVLSVYGKHRNSNVGLGGVVFSDRVGHTSRNGLSLSYAYHFSLSDAMKMSLALSGGFSQIKIDPSLINFEDVQDPLMTNGILNSTVPDATFAFNLYTKKWFIGASIPQLLNSKMGFFEEDFLEVYNLDPDGSLERHYFIMAGYKWIINQDYLVEPLLLVKSVEGVSPVVDIGMRTIYQNKLWLGINYRHKGANSGSDIGMLLGYSIGDRYIIGYSYDFGSLGEIAAGSHEFMLGIKFIPTAENK